MSWAEFVPRKVFQVLIHITCECDLIQKQGLCRCTPVKMSITLDQDGPQMGPSIWCPYYEENIWEISQWSSGQDAALSWPKARVQCLVREVRSSKPRSMAKLENNNKNKITERKETFGCRETQTCSGEDHVKTRHRWECCSCKEELQGLLAIARGRGEATDFLPQSPGREQGPASTLLSDFQPLEGLPWWLKWSGIAKSWT